MFAISSAEELDDSSSSAAAARLERSGILSSPAACTDVKSTMIWLSDTALYFAVLKKSFWSSKTAPLFLLANCKTKLQSVLNTGWESSTVKHALPSVLHCQWNLTELASNGLKDNLTSMKRSSVSSSDSVTRSNSVWSGMKPLSLLIWRAKRKTFLDCSSSWSYSANSVSFLQIPGPKTDSQLFGSASLTSSSGPTCSMILR